MIPTRRFGRTELPMPVLSLGGMRFQQSWSDLAADAIEAESQRNLEATLSAAVAAGFHHVETARYYGTSELQLGPALARHPDPERILQTKIPPRDDPAAFEAELERSFSLLGVERVELLAVHGLNLREHLEQTLRPGGCMEVLRRWQADGAIGHVGFSATARWSCCSKPSPAMPSITSTCIGITSAKTTALPYRCAGAGHGRVPDQSHR